MLKLQYFGDLMWRTNSLEKTVMLGKIEGRRRRGWQRMRRGWQRMRWLDGITEQWTWVWASYRSWWWIGKHGVLQSMGSQRVRHCWATELNRTDMLTTTAFIDLSCLFFHVLDTGSIYLLTDSWGICHLLQLFILSYIQKLFWTILIFQR